MAKNYKALTRTYRPHTFDDIVSQEHVSSTLKNAIKQNRLSHAYMFCGPRGVGKTTMARVLARTINDIGEQVDGESLSQTLNIVEIDAASNNKVDDIHNLRETVRVPPQSGNYKIFIIDEVHMLSKAAFNALLKTLEEPPEHAIFIFATTEPHKVLPTILSRVQRFDFKRITVDEIVSRLKAICEKEDITIDEESLHVIAKKADGALRDALGLMDQAIAFCGTDIHYNQLIEALNVVGLGQLFEFTKAVADKNSDTGLLLIDSLMKNGVDIQEFLVSLTEHIRNLYVAKQGERMHLVEATEDTKNQYRKTSEQFTEEDLMRMLHMVSEAQIKIKEVQQPKVHFEILMLKLIHMSRTKELNTLLSDLSELKKKGLNQPADPKPEAVSQSAPKKGKTDNNGAKEELHQQKVRESAKQDPVKADKPNPAKKSELQPVKREFEKTETAERKTEPAPSKNSEDDELQELLMGRPSLGIAEGISSVNGGEEGQPVEAEKSETDYVEAKPISSIKDVEECWNDYLEVVKENVPRTLYFQMLRVRLQSLKGSTLIVTADNELASNLLDENQKLLSSLFKKTIGTRLRLKCTVQRKEKSKSESMSPYDRFVELQKKDKNLQTIVELFGAELEY